jgi:Flp pilus assembly pilin Flp
MNSNVLKMMLFWGENMRLFWRRLKEEKGQGSFEYSLLLALLVLSAVAGMHSLTGSLSNAFSEASASTSLTSVVGKVTAGTREFWSTTDFSWHTTLPQVNEKVMATLDHFAMDMQIGKRISPR